MHFPLCSRWECVWLISVGGSGIQGASHCLARPQPSGVAREPPSGSRTRLIPDKDIEQTKCTLKGGNPGNFPLPMGSRRREGPPP